MGLSFERLRDSSRFFFLEGWIGSTTMELRPWSCLYAHGSLLIDLTSIKPGSVTCKYFTHCTITGTLVYEAINGRVLDIKESSTTLSTRVSINLPLSQCPSPYFFPLYPYSWISFLMKTIMFLLLLNITNHYYV